MWFRTACPDSGSFPEFRTVIIPSGGLSVGWPGGRSVYSITKRQQQSPHKGMVGLQWQQRALWSRSNISNNPPSVEAIIQGLGVLSYVVPVINRCHVGSCKIFIRVIEKANDE